MLILIIIIVCCKTIDVSLSIIILILFIKKIYYIYIIINIYEKYIENLPMNAMLDWHWNKEVIDYLLLIVNGKSKEEINLLIIDMLNNHLIYYDYSSKLSVILNMLEYLEHIFMGGLVGLLVTYIISNC